MQQQRQTHRFLLPQFSRFSTLGLLLAAAAGATKARPAAAVAILPSPGRRHVLSPPLSPASHLAAAAAAAPPLLPSLKALRKDKRLSLLFLYFSKQTPDIIKKTSASSCCAQYFLSLKKLRDSYFHMFLLRHRVRLRLRLLHQLA